MLHQLIEYSKKEGLDPEPGFTTHEIKWEVQIDKDGKLINVIPLGDKDGGKDTPKCPLMHNMNAGGRSHFLVESVQTVALLFKKNEEAKKIEEAKTRHQHFFKIIQEAAEGVSLLKPLALFLADPQQVTNLREKLLKDAAKPNDRLKWQVDGVDVVADSVVRDWWRSWRKKDLGKGEESAGSEMVCFLSGDIVRPLLAHNKIKRIVGGQPSGDVVVGCDKDAFVSFGLEKSSNAAMGDIYASAYVDALNHLIKNHSNKLANTLVVHWFKESIRPEVDPLAFICESSDITDASAQNSARQILESLKKGQRPVPANNRYFAMTISGASGRVMVRDWMEGGFAELVSNVMAWFDDFEITNYSGKQVEQDPKIERVVTCILPLRNKDQKYNDWVKPIGHARINLLHAAIQRRAIPFNVIARLVSRLPAFFISEELKRVLFGKQDDSENVGLYLSILCVRMGLLKAYFIRKGGNHCMSAYLNPEHPHPAYHCGRFLAVLARLQSDALGDVGAGVVQRYYTGASQTPGLVIGHLASNAKNHLGKLEGRLADKYEDQIADVMSRIKDSIPRTLTLEEQGLFALGYYQQIAALNAENNR